MINLDEIYIGNDVIYYIRFNQMFYILHGDKDQIYMDYNIWEKAYEEKFGVIDSSLKNDFSFRYGIKCLNNNNIKFYLNEAKDKIINNDEFVFLKKTLAENYKKISSDEDKEYIIDFMSLFPSVYLNFDENIFYSYYRDMILFEEYVPSDWKGVYMNFYDLIPLEKRYWIVDGIDYSKNNKYAV